MKRLHFQLLLAASTLILSIASFFIVIRSASNEPYTTFRGSDAIEQIGVAMMLTLLWFQLAVATVAGLIHWRISPWWLSLIVWVLICEFYLFDSTRGYIQDITQYLTEPHYSSLQLHSPHPTPYTPHPNLQLVAY